MKKSIQHIGIAAITLVMLLLFPICSSAQQSKCAISGHITDVKNVPVAYAAVAIYDDARPIAGSVTDDNGKFNMKVPRSSGTYALVVEFIGYKRYTLNLIPDKSSIDLGRISCV